MKRIVQAFTCVLLLTGGVSIGFAADKDAGFFGGLGDAFSEMGRNFADVVQGRSSGDVEPVGKNATAGRAMAQGSQTVYEIQYRLGALGYDPGAADGLMGSRTRAAISAFQHASGLPADGQPSARVLGALRSASSNLTLPERTAAAARPAGSDTSSISSTIGGVVGSLANVLSSSKANGPMARAGVPVHGRPNDNMAMALGALASGAPDPAARHPAQNQAAAISGLVRGGGVPASLANGVATIQSGSPDRPAATPKGQTYLDAMVAEQEAQAYRLAHNVDPKTREMARRSGIDLDGAVARQLAEYEQYKKDAAEIEHRSSVAAQPRPAPNTREAATQHPQALPSVLAGRWEGKVSYEPHRISSALPRKHGQQTRVRLDVDPARGLLVVTYPDLNCDGVMRANMSVLSKAGVNRHEIIDYPLEEHLARRSQNCIDGGKVYLSHWAAYQGTGSPRKGQLMFKWVSPHTNEPAMFGRLLPASDVADGALIVETERKSNERLVEIISSNANGCRFLEIIDSSQSNGLMPQNAAPSGWNAGKRAIAKQLLASYSYETRRINSVADYADIALLAWASYEDDDALKQAAGRGWQCVKVYREPPRGEYVSDTVAVLFRSPKSRYVLAFRGTKDRGDWVTNAGTFSCVDSGNLEIESARRIARMVVSKYGYVEFAGHSLGGRMAQAARYEIGSKAIVFNSAPPGCNDIKKSDKSTSPLAPVVAFRSPEDVLSGYFSPNDTIVANIRDSHSGRQQGFIGRSADIAANVRYKHSMEVLARAMQDVRMARDEGWISTFMSEQINQSSPSR